MNIQEQISEWTVKVRPHLSQWLVFLTPVIVTAVLMTPSLHAADWPLWGIALMWLLDAVAWFTLFFGLSHLQIFWGQVGDNRTMAVYQGERLIRIALNSIMYKFLGGTGVTRWKLIPINPDDTRARSITGFRNIFELFGMYWIGIPGFVTVRPVRYETELVKKVKKTGGDGNEYHVTKRICIHETRTPSIFFRHDWESINVETLSPRKGSDIKDEPSSGKLLVDVANGAQWLVENPYLFYFGSEPTGTISKITNTALATDGEILRNMTFEQVSLAKSEEGEMTDEQLKQKNFEELSYGQRLRLRLNREPKEGVRSVRTYGVLLLDHDLIEIQPSDKAAANALRDVEIKRLQAEGEIEEGRGIAGKVREVGFAHADVTRAEQAAKAMGVEWVVNAAGGSIPIAVSHLQKEAMALAAGEGPNKTRPNVVSIGGNALTPTLDLSNYTDRERVEPSGDRSYREHGKGQVVKPTEKPQDEQRA